MPKQQNLKQKLLLTNYFIDNQYLDDYINLVSNNQVKKEAFKTQQHHIIPKTYFKHLKLAIDNSMDNLVELLYADHVKAHWLLQKCTIGFLKRNNGYAIRFLINNKNFNTYNPTMDDWIFLQKLYEDSIITVDEQEFKIYYKNHSNIETANYFNINRVLVVELARKYNCLKNPKRQFAKARTEIAISELYDYYITNKHSLAEAASYFNVDKSTIIRRLNDGNIAQLKNRYKHNNRSDYKRDLTDYEISEFKAYYTNHTVKELSNKFNMSHSCVIAYISKLGISKKKNFNYNEIYNYYKSYGASKTIIKFNISKSHLYRIIHKQEEDNS